MKNIEILDWDTKHFGYKVARINSLSLSPDELKDILQELSEKGVKLVYWFIDPKDKLSNKAARENYGFWADEKVTYLRRLTGKIEPTLNPKNIKSYFHKPLNDRLLHLALEAGLYSRYKVDPGFVNREFETLYLEWIRKSLKGEIAKETLAYIQDGKEIGLVTIGRKNDRANIGLIAVDKGFRGLNVGSNLMIEAMRWAIGRGYKFMDVVTQKANVKTCEFYEKLGFREEGVQNIYHFWLPHDARSKFKEVQYNIPFNKPYLAPNSLLYIKQACLVEGKLSGDGAFTKKCNEWLEETLGTKKALLTHSCTAALDMAAILADVVPEDEVIMPSFTFASTANAFVLRGAKPVFVDVRMDTLNINEDLVEAAVTPKTRGIMVVHYAGVGCEMDKIIEIAKKYKLLVFEDAAQAILAKYKGQFLGTFGSLSAISFHETKNVISGEGGALLINKEDFIERAEIIREKGTNRNKFLRGEVDKYTWIDIGSSYLPGEATAAFLFSQLEQAQKLIVRRLEIWEKYHEGLYPLEKMGFIRRPIIPADCQHNGHIYYILLENLEVRTKLIEYLKERGILSVFHYVPLHSSPAGQKFGRFVGSMNVTNKVSDTLLRLPMYYELSNNEIEYVIKSVRDFFEK